jgi:hypothetical protein
MRVGEIALKGLVQRVRSAGRQHQPTASIRLAIHGEDLPSITLDRSMQFGDIVWGAAAWSSIAAKPVDA